MPEIPIRRALISVYDKTGVVDFARALHDEFNIEIISTGGTAKLLREAGVPVTLVEDITGFPEMLDGRVKTLHPKIHAAILADRDNPEHMRQLAAQGIEPIDMVVVNLYPFEETIAREDCTRDEAIEMIDIGGPCLLRAAAKNHRHVLAVSSPEWYGPFLEFVRRWDDDIQRAGALETGALHAFMTTSGYDARVAEWLSADDEGAPVYRLLRFFSWGPLRYGENPHQAAELLSLEDDPDCDLLQVAETRTAEENFDALAESQPMQPRMSMNNYVDADAALQLCAELTRASIDGRRRLSANEIMAHPATKPSSGGTGFQPVCGERTTRRNLPHWQIEGSIYFITFRTRNFELSPDERTIVLNACRYWDESKIALHAAVVMPDHVHLLLTPLEQPGGGSVALGEIIKSIKGYTARIINEQRERTGPFWLDEYFDRIIRNPEELEEKWNYIANNPVKQELATSPEDYAWLYLMELNERHRLKAGATENSSAGAACCVFIKHTNACGAGVHVDPVEAYRRAYLGDANAAMGGILAVNFDVTAEFADVVMNSLKRWGKDAGAGAFFVEVWIAPQFDDDAIEYIESAKSWGKRVRMLGVGDMNAPLRTDAFDIRQIAGGAVFQSRDLVGLNEDEWKVVTKRRPSEQEMADLRLAWLVCKHTKSNAISICKDGMLIGNGAGQMSRVMSCRIATWLAKDNGHADQLAGSAAASDAFFPFRDGPDVLMDAGVTAIIQPGGSKRDADTIAACDERDVAMILTGTRHFKH